MTKLLSKNIIDLTDNTSTAQALSKFEELLGSNGFTGTTLSVVLGKLVFTHGHMARLEALAKQHEIQVDVIYTSAVQTQLSALNSNFLVSEKAPGEMILEEFKNSLHDLPEDFSESNNVEAQATESNEAVTLESQMNSPVDDVDTPVNEEQHHLPNDVVEVLDLDEQMVQQKMNLDLPFERKVNVLDSLKVEIELDPEKTKPEEMTTLLIEQTLRSGQIIAHKGHVVITGDTHPGSEVVAGGDIIVWGTLGGVAHAGAGNNYKASIRALKMNPIQLRIADYIARRPDKKYEQGKELPLKPEVARIANGEIRIYSLK